MFPNEWMLASRIRFALVQTALTVGILLGIQVLGNGLDNLGEGVWYWIAGALIAFVANGWIWYPRAKRKAHHSA